MNETYRIIRDIIIARWVKYVHMYRCQICGETVYLQNGRLYAEAHHLKPLGNPYNGPDVVDNIICVCPNHHAQLDYGAIEVNRENLKIVSGHDIKDEYLNYYNSVVVKRGQVN